MRQGLLTVAAVRSTGGWMAAAALIAAVSAAAQAGGAGTTVEDVSRSTPTPIAVVELFTSEGCPTCPPADKVLGDLGREARARGIQVFPLAFHVDYWNRPGARDPFSDATYSQRQAAYKQALQFEDRYTPQMIVNGRVEFVGSQRETASRMVSEALRRPARASVTMQAKATGDKAEVEYAIKGAAAGSSVHVAVIEREVTSRSRSGRVFEHENVVRSFRTTSLARDGKGSSTVDLPLGSDPSKLMVLVYVQERDTMEVLGAAGTDLERVRQPARVANARGERPVGPLP